MIGPGGEAPALVLSGWRRLLVALVISYVVLVVAMWAWMRWDGDRSWLATLVLFGPRWLCALPLPLLGLPSAIWHRRLLLPLAMSAVVIVGPMMGFQVHWPARATGQATLRVMTCNVEHYSL